MYTRESFHAALDAADKQWVDSGYQRLILSDDEFIELARAMEEAGVGRKVQQAAMLSLAGGAAPRDVTFSIYSTLFELGMLYERRRREEEEFKKMGLEI